MERLRPRDYRVLLDFLAGAYATTSLEGFAQHVASNIGSIIPVEGASYNELNPKRKRIEWIVHGCDPSPVSPELFCTFMHEHPLIGVPAGLVRQITDFIAPSEWRRRGMFAEFYRLVGVENMMTVRLASPRNIEIVVCAMRDGRGFTEREQLLMELFHPHLAQAYANVEASSVQASELALLPRPMRCAPSAQARAFSLAGRQR